MSAPGSILSSGSRNTAAGPRYLTWDVTMESGKIRTMCRKRVCLGHMHEPGLRDAAVTQRRLQAAGLPTIRWV